MHVDSEVVMTLPGGLIVDIALSKVGNRQGCPADPLSLPNALVLIAVRNAGDDGLDLHRLVSPRGEMAVGRA